MSGADSRRWSIWSLAVAAIFPFGAFEFSRNVLDNSFLWHVRAGDAQIRGLGVLTTDPFTFTANGEPWRTQSWLVELGYSWLDERIGLWQVPIIVLVCWLVFVTAALAIIRTATRSPLATALALGMTAVVVIGFFNPRPVVFSMVLAALIVLADHFPKLRWTIPLIMWIWVSSHGSFPIGAAYLIFQAIRYRDRARVAPIVAGGVASLLTAHGIGVLQILTDFGGSGEALDYITEWATPNLLSPPFIPVLLAVLAFIYAAMKGALAPRDLWLIVPFMVVMLRANRTVPPAWIVLLPLIAASVGSVKAIPLTARMWRGIPIGLAIAGTVAGVAIAKTPEPDPERFPTLAATHLVGDRVFASDGAGGYLVYAYWPDRLIYVDDRAELLGELVPEMVNTRGGKPEWREVFARWGFDEALLGPEDPLTELLGLSGWNTVYQDEYWVLLRK